MRTLLGSRAFSVPWQKCLNSSQTEVAVLLAMDHQMIQIMMQNYRRYTNGPGQTKIFLEGAWRDVLFGDEPRRWLNRKWRSGSSAFRWVGWSGDCSAFVESHRPVQRPCPRGHLYDDMIQCLHFRIKHNRIIVIFPNFPKHSATFQAADLSLTVVTGSQALKPPPWPCLKNACRKFDFTMKQPSNV